MKQKLTGLKVSDLNDGDVIGMFVCDGKQIGTLGYLVESDGDRHAFCAPTIQSLIDAFGVVREVELETVASGTVDVATPMRLDGTAFVAKPGDDIEVRRAK